MDALEKDEFIRAYRNIVGQLKRKFVRRPNVVEAIEAYDVLARQQDDLGFAELSAICRLSAARLEQAVNSNPNSVNLNRSSEFQMFLDSARSYSRLPDTITTALCYEAAVNSCTDESLAWMTSMEAGETSSQKEDYAMAITFFTRALQLASDDGSKIISREKLASMLIRQGLLGDALKVLQESHSTNCEVTCLLLALNLRNNSNGDSKISQMVKSVLEESVNSVLPAELNIVLISLIEGDLEESLISVIWKYLSVDQQQLLLCLCV